MINRRGFFKAAASLSLSRGFIPGLAAALFAPRALRGLQLLGDDEAWAWWKQLPRSLLTASNDPVTAVLIRSASDRATVQIVYGGGAEPGKSRRISPLGVFTVEGYGGIYLYAYCHRRQSERTFRIDRILALA